MVGVVEEMWVNVRASIPRAACKSPRLRLIVDREDDVGEPEGI